MAFHTNIGCHSAGPPDLGIVCIDLTLLTRLSASLTAIIVALMVSVAACIIACVMLSSTAILSFFSLDCIVQICLFSVFSTALFETYFLFLLTLCNVTCTEG